MADQRIQYTERMVGTGHPIFSDTLNRLALVGHNSDGSHKGYVEASQEGNLTETIAAVPTTTMIVITNDQTLYYGTTIEHPIHILPGATLITNTGATIFNGPLTIDGGGALAGLGAYTINGPFQCGLSHCFTGSGAVTFGAGSVAEVYPEWFGNNFDIITNAEAINTAYRNFIYNGNTAPPLLNKFNTPVGRINSNNINDIVYADKNNIVGMHENFAESTSIASANTNGTVLEAPMYQGNEPSCPVDIVGLWYNDFGLEFTRTGGGSATWYTWEWNHTDAATYDEARHPVLGWYRGDEANVLDWQCYWLREAGMKAVVLPTAGLSGTTGVAVDTSSWSTSSDRYYWLYNLFNNAKNFRGLQYAAWMPYDGTNYADAAAVLTAWTTLINDLYLTYRNFYTISHNGKLYPVVYVFEAANLWTKLGGTEAASVSFFQSVSNLFKAEGFGGVAVFARHPKGDYVNASLMNRKALEDVGCLYFSADYSGTGSWTAYIPVSDETSYQTMMEGWSALVDQPAWVVSTAYTANDIITSNGWIYQCKTGHTSSSLDNPGEGKNWTTYWYKLGLQCQDVAAIPTSHYALSPHPSYNTTYWKAANPTPELFERWLRKGVQSAYNAGSPAVLVYNIAEWAEGGPGLQPNRQDGKGYLDAVRNVTTQFATVAKPVFPKASGTIVKAFVAATTQIPCENEILKLSTDAARTMTSTPTIKAGTDGQVITLINENASNTITLQDNATLAGSTLFLSATTIVLGPYDSLKLMYISGKGWVQISQTNTL